MINMTNSTALAAKLVREQIARKQAETLLEEKSHGLIQGQSRVASSRTRTGGAYTNS